MSTKIAVFSGENNRLTTVFDPCTVKVMEKIDDKWHATREISVFLDMKNGIADFRNNISNFVSAIKDVNVILAAEVSGIPYKVFDQEGFDICECEELSIDFLDKILEAKNNQEVRCEAYDVGEVNTEPVESEIVGNYVLDLKKLFANKTSLTSKQALLPFLKHTPFHMLEVLCSHVPLWFDLEFEKLSLNKEITKISENDYIVKIYKNTCYE